MYQKLLKRGQAMQEAKVVFQDKNTQKKFVSFLEKLIAKTLFELYCADQYPFVKKVDRPHE